MRDKQRFFRRISRLLRLLWLAAFANAALVPVYIGFLVEFPGEAMARGLTVGYVPAMVEHVLMSAVLLLLCGIATEIIRRTY